MIIAWYTWWTVIALFTLWLFMRVLEDALRAYKARTEVLESQGAASLNWQRMAAHSINQWAQVEYDIKVKQLAQMEASGVGAPMCGNCGQITKGVK